MDKALADAVAHARAEYPRESCGLIVAIGKRRQYVPCRNSASDAWQEFLILPEDYLAADAFGDVVSVVHSHPDVDGQPRPTDVVSHSANGLHWTIIGLPNGKDGEPDIVQMPAAGELPLLGRTFHHGAIDCYTLIRDYYWQVLAIELPDFHRPDDWWANGMDLYVQNFAKAGFVQVDSPQHGDVVLMAVMSPTTNHGGIWLDGDIILHHLPKRISCQEVYGRYYRERTTHFLRYQPANDQAAG